jgi:hypothetical protein
VFQAAACLRHDAFRAAPRALPTPLDTLRCHSTSLLLLKAAGNCLAAGPRPSQADRARPDTMPDTDIEPCQPPPVSDTAKVSRQGAGSRSLRLFNLPIMLLHCWELLLRSVRLFAARMLFVFWVEGL